MDGHVNDGEVSRIRIYTMTTRCSIVRLKMKNLVGEVFRSGAGDLSISALRVIDPEVVGWIL